jgi:cytochrome c-type biogenesis protein CcmH/NrfG
MKPAVAVRLAGPIIVTAALGAGIAAAQNTMAGVRGKVVDEKGAGIEGVKIDMEFQGESRQKITKSQVTDKKGAFVRMGLPGGPWQMTFSREGYQTYVMKVELSLGGFSDQPDVVMKPAAAAAPAAAGPTDAPVLPPESAKVGDVYNKAVEATKAGNLDEAEALYKEVLDKLPNLAEAYYNLGQIYVRKKDMESAESSFRKVVELQPQKSDSYIALAALMGSAGKGPEAVDLLVQASPAFEQDAKFQFALATTSLNAGRSKEAEAALQKVKTLEPSNAEPYFHLATLHVGENKVPEAVAELEKYVSLTGQDPRNLETARQLIAALKKKP